MPDNPATYSNTYRGIAGYEHVNVRKIRTTGGVIRIKPATVPTRPLRLRADNRLGSRNPFVYC